MFTRRCVLSASVLAFGLDRAGFAQEQSYPDRVIKLIVPFPAGGPTDIMGRLAGQLISSALGQTVVVENRPGAGGTIGSQDVAARKRRWLHIAVGRHQYQRDQRGDLQESQL